MNKQDITLILSFKSGQDQKFVPFVISPSLKFKDLWNNLREEYKNLDCLFFDNEEIESGDNVVREMTLEELKLKDKSVLELGFKQNHCAGIPGIPGADLSNLKKAEKIKVESNPNARQANCINKGLNIRGKCVNNVCKEFNLEVVYRAGIGKLDYLDKLESIICPECKKKIEGVIFLFYNCEYNIKGHYLKPGVSGKQYFEGDKWERADRECHRFMKEVVGEINYLEVLIETKEIDDFPSNRNRTA